MTFYDIDPINLPEDAVYYHNVLVVCVGITPQLWEYENYEEIWYLEYITSPQPTAYCFYVEPELEQEEEDAEIDFEIIIVSNCVVEVCNNEISWYDGAEDNFTV